MVVQEGEGEGGVAAADIGVLLRRAATTEVDVLCPGEGREIVEGCAIGRETCLEQGTVGAREGVPRCGVPAERGGHHLRRGAQDVVRVFAGVLPDPLRQGRRGGASDHRITGQHAASVLLLPAPVQDSVRGRVRRNGSRSVVRQRKGARTEEALFGADSSGAGPDGWYLFTGGAVSASRGERLVKRTLRAAGIALSSLCLVAPARLEHGRVEAPGGGSDRAGSGDGQSMPGVEVSQGGWVRIFDARSFLGAEHAVNDHCLVRDAGGRWHLFGIFQAQSRWDEELETFVHAVAAPPAEPGSMTSLRFEFANPPFALKRDASLGETHLWAPHVVQDGDRWLMFYQSGGPHPDRAGIRVAESTDLFAWRRIGAGPLFEDLCVARDPMVFRAGGVWIMYYTRCDDSASRTSGVAYRTSRDLLRWSEPAMALVVTGSEPMFNSGYTESPFVFERGGWYYLSVTAYPVAWDATLVYRSRSPFAFTGPPFARLRAHAAEWISDPGSGAVSMSHAGPGQGGVWLTPVTGL